MMSIREVIDMLYKFFVLFSDFFGKYFNKEETEEDAEEIA